VGTRRQSFLGISVVEGDLPELAKVGGSRGRSGAVADEGGQSTRHYGSGADHGWHWMAVSLALQSKG
jgi:hypothetical protein